MNASSIDLDPLLEVIEAYLPTVNLTATSFGQLALNDPTLVHEMRKGRECKRATRKKIIDFMASYTEDSKAERGE